MFFGLKAQLYKYNIPLDIECDPRLDGVHMHLRLVADLYIAKTKYTFHMREL